jgi:hypothetical protein
MIESNGEKEKENQLNQLIVETNKSPLFTKEEKIFKFCDESIIVEKTIENCKFKLKNIKIMNISQKEYKSDKLIWYKEEQSDKDINFDQKIIKKEDQIFPCGKEIDDLSLDLCIDKPKERDYIILISIKDNESNKVISLNHLKIIVKMRDKLISVPESAPISLQERFEADRIKAIWKNLAQLNFFDLVSKYQKKINEIIKKENGNVSRIKIWVMQKIEKEKKHKMSELLNKYRKDFEFTKVANDENQKKQIILDLKFEEEKIMNWIEENSDDINIKKIDAEEIFNRLDDEFVVSCFLDKEELIGKIKEFNYDYEKVQNWVEEQI